MQWKTKSRTLKTVSVSAPIRPYKRRHWAMPPTPFMLNARLLFGVLQKSPCRVFKHSPCKKRTVNPFPFVASGCSQYNYYQERQAKIQLHSLFSQATRHHFGEPLLQCYPHIFCGCRSLKTVSLFCK